LDSLADDLTTIQNEHRFSRRQIQDHAGVGEAPAILQLLLVTGSAIYLCRSPWAVALEFA
jgi:hypothetical protein